MNVNPFKKNFRQLQKILTIIGAIPPDCAAGMGVSQWAVIHAPELSCGLDIGSMEYREEASWRIPEEYIKSSVGAGMHLRQVSYTVFIWFFDHADSLYEMTDQR